MSSPSIAYSVRVLWVIDIPLYEREYLGTKSGVRAGQALGF